MFKLLFLLPVVALLDPLLLMWLWPHLSLTAIVCGLVVLPLCVNFIARRKIAAGANHFTGLLRIATRIIAWYPGPISKFISVLLLFPPVERALARKAVSMVLGKVLSPEQRSAMNAAQQRGAPGAGVRDVHGLKRAPGRVIK